MTGISRTPIRKPQSVARLPRTFSQSLLFRTTNLSVLGLTSRREADRLTHDIEKLRNHLAHAQELESGHLATAARLASFIHSILRAEGAQRIIGLQRDTAAYHSATSLSP